MKINNKETKVVNGPKLNDKDIMIKTISYLKDIEKNYCIALTEASNENLFNKYLKQFDSIKTYQRHIYAAMFQNGWYKLETAEKAKVKETYQTLNKLFKDNIKKAN